MKQTAQEVIQYMESLRYAIEKMTADERHYWMNVR